jgi:glycosyltransferase involved in cell wall biosynthesis
VRRRLLILNWRDTRHPEGGGSEVYVEQVAFLLRDKGYEVTLFSAQSPGLPRSEYRDGLHFVRRGGHLTVYLWAALLQTLGRLGRPDVVLEVQNGMPFLARLYARRPVVILVHHVHREQWPVVGPLLSRVGWLLESRIAPWVNRRCPYVAVSGVTKSELVDLGVSAQRITVAYNGVPPAPDLEDMARSPSPRIAVLSRLVPHKQIEHAIICLARLQAEFPGLTLVVMGSGWWHDELLAQVGRCGVGDQVRFTGHVDDVTKHRELATAWVHLLPSLKEGWGLSIIEAGTHATPTVAYYAAGGVKESIQDSVTGLLAVDLDDLVSCTRTLLTDEALRTSLGTKAQTRAHDFSWSTTAEQVARVLDSA